MTYSASQTAFQALRIGGLAVALDLTAPGIVGADLSLLQWVIALLVLVQLACVVGFAFGGTQTQATILATEDYAEQLERDGGS